MKLRQFQTIVSEKADVAILLNPDSNVGYFCENEIYGFACLIVPAKKNPFLITSLLDYEQAREKVKLEVVSFREKKRFLNFLTDLFRKRGIKYGRVAVNKKALSYAMFEKLKKALKARFVDVSDELKRLREVKTKKEIEFIEKACRIGDKVLSKVFDLFHKFRTESDVEAELFYHAKKYFADRSFKAIIASGRNGSMPHHMTRNKRLQKGFCIIDFGVRYKGYCSDMTRTVFIGKPKKKERELYELVLKAQTNAIKNVEAGMKCKELHQFAVRMLGRYGKYFIHGLGHGIGVDIHESPSISPFSDDCFKKGMVFTIEPGIYAPHKYGIRIEDVVLLEKRPRVLTRSKKELVCF